jgi:hypothetical protein
LQFRGAGATIETMTGENSGWALEVGQLRRQSMLDTEAVYRVVELGEETVRVEVISAPGLPAGGQFEFAAAAVQRMELLDGQP